MSERFQFSHNRRRNREAKRLMNVLNCIDSGRADHMFHDAKTKAHVKRDFEQQLQALVKEEFQAHPDEFRKMPDGSWALINP